MHSDAMERDVRGLPRMVIAPSAPIVVLFLGPRAKGGSRRAACEAGAGARRFLRCGTRCASPLGREAFVDVPLVHLLLGGKRTRGTSTRATCHRARPTPRRRHPTTLEKRNRRPLAAGFVFGGGAGRDRTDDLKLAKLALSQLSYSPKPGRNLACAFAFGESLSHRSS
jgi:hypothetical protein